MVVAYGMNMYNYGIYHTNLSGGFCVPVSWGCKWVLACSGLPQAEVHTNQFDKDVLCFNKFVHVTSWGMDQPW